MTFLREHILLILLLLSAVVTFAWLLRFRTRLQMSWFAAAALSLLHVCYGVFCVKAFAFLESGAASDGFSQMSIFGATFFMPLGYFLGAKLTKRKIADVFDIFTPCMLFTLACSRVNCLVAGCCAGVPFFGTEWLWPTREIEIVFYLAFLATFVPRVMKQKTTGEVYPLYMLSYGALRFLLEFARASEVERLFHLSHLWAALSVLTGLAIYLEQRARITRRKCTSMR